VTNIAIRGLTMSFGEVQVLRGIDLDVPSGSLTAILGPSGCGKTTLLRLIAGFDTPDAGTIEIGNEVVAGAGRVMPPERRRLGYVAQEGALFPHMRVDANIAFGLPAKERHNRAYVGELLSLVGLDETHLQRYPHELSGGQQQRVALARALAARPRIVLLDEPFASLDAGLRDGTRRAVGRALAATHATAILVTHDQAEALSMADQVAVMRAGSLLQVGPPHEVYAAPVDTHVARFLGEAVILPGIVRDGSASTVIGDVAVSSEAPNGPAEIMIRPEQIALCPLDASVGIEASIEEVTFYGPYTTVGLRLVSSDIRIVARAPGYTVAVAGDRVRVEVQGRVVAYPRSPAP
jgi:iron(III) transport system ATP-binding protein